MKKWGVLAIVVAIIVGSPLMIAMVSAQQGGTEISRGGLLYDKWWKVTGAEEPATDQPLWATQDTNTRSGDDTWRCKECHGWDYQGKDGAYSSGSHFTGFPGVLAAQGKSPEELAAALAGAANADHDFSSALDEASIEDLVTFLTEGTIDMRQYIDYDTKTPKNADVNHGSERYAGLCAMCHGADGTMLNWGSEEEPEYIGTIADANPQEFLHKVRFGQPATLMPSTIDMGWSIQDAVDVLAYAQTLPTGAQPAAEAPAAEEPAAEALLPETGGSAVAIPQILVVLGLLIVGLGMAFKAARALQRARF